MPDTRQRVARWLVACCTALFFSSVCAATGPAPEPILIGLDAEFGNKTSTADDAIKTGVQIAIDEINAQGGVVDGRPLALVLRDNRGVPARGVDNFRELAAMPELVAVIGAKFSPVILAQMPLAEELGLPLIDAWGSADGVTSDIAQHRFTFRVSLRDGWVMPFLFGQARDRGFRKIGLLVPNGAWGRSNHRAALNAAAAIDIPSIVDAIVYEWADDSLRNELDELLAAGAEAIILVANEPEAAKLVKAMLEIPADRRLPVLAHWGAAGGPLPLLSGRGLFELDIQIVQTMSFVGNRNPIAQRIGTQAMRRLAVETAGLLPSPPGIAHGYDAVQILVAAIRKAHSTERRKLRQALENLPPVDGLVRRYAPAFTSDRHDALGPDNLILVRWREDGSLAPDSRQ